MKTDSRNGTGRPARLGRRVRSDVEALEARQLLTGGANPLRFYHPTILPPATHVTDRSAVHVTDTGYADARAIANADNQGKVVHGQDRQGDQWVIRVQGPGYVIVTDTTPNDGALDDEINTIQLVGTDRHRTVVIGNVSSSNRVITDGTVKFNSLFADQGVKDVILNGFTFAETDPPSSNTVTGSPNEIDLPGGVNLLQFHNIDAAIDRAAGTQPFNIVIGTPDAPLSKGPIIRLDSIFNTVFTSRASNPAGVPQTTPTVNIIVNGTLRGLDMLTVSRAPVPAGDQFNFPNVGTTGRTAVRAVSVGHIKVVGTTNNLTVSRGAVPFQDDFSGVLGLRSAVFGGVTDGVGLDVNGRISNLVFARGLGDPTGTVTADTQLGTPADEAGQASYGLLGGQVTATDIGNVSVGPADLQRITPNDPAFAQLGTSGSQTYLNLPGTAMINAVVVASGSIDKIHVIGNLVASQVNTGFDYQQYLAGLEPNRQPSAIASYGQNGSLIDSVIAATYRPVDGIYNNGNDVKGRGRIAGNLHGTLAGTGTPTALNFQGVGFYARHKRGKLPPRP